MKDEIVTYRKSFIKRSITGEESITALKQAGFVKENEFLSDVCCRVPGGGDWSNTDLSLSDDGITLFIKN